MNCLHPVRVDDPKHKGHKMLVPCGHCECCLKRRADMWNDRMKVEASQHKYHFFITLTYSDEFVPIFRPEECLDYPFFTDKQREDTYNYLCEHDASEQYLVLRYHDIQNFLKRLRKYIYDDKNICKEQSTFRYVCVGEYGETTHRPHYHLVLFADNDYLCNRRLRHFKGGVEKSIPSPFEMYVRKAWQVEDKSKCANRRFLRRKLGRIDFQPVRDHACRYVAGYVTSFSYIPSLLRCSAFRPFIQASKSPVIGSFGFDKEEAKRIILHGTNYMVNKCGNEADRNNVISLWRSFTDRLFPKLPNYSSLNSFERKLLYGIVQESGFKDFSEWLVYFTNPVLTDYYLLQLRDDVAKALKINDVDLMLKLVQSDGCTRNSLVRLWRVSALFAYNCNIYEFKSSQYADLIDKFYNGCDANGLSNQLAFEKQYTDLGGDPRDLVSYIDPLYAENLSIESANAVRSSFGFSDDDDPADFDFYRHPQNRALLDKDVVFVNVGKSYKAKSDYVIHKGLSNVNVI